MVQNLCLRCLGMISLVGWLGAFFAGDAVGEDSVRVVSFNIRYGSADDGLDSWDKGHRKEKAIQAIKGLDADILGLQEAEVGQVRQVLKACERYSALGIARDDGRLAGEASPILYDRERFLVSESGVFWFGDNPSVPGAKSLDAAFPRICTWARLVECQTGRGLYVYNTHYDHRGKKARAFASGQIRRHLAAKTQREGQEDPVIVMGDFNASESSEPYRVLIGEEAKDKAPKLGDTFRMHFPDEKVTTFSGFKLESLLPGRKIDHIFIGPGLGCEAAGIDQRKIAGRYPSDHFPVWAVLTWGER